MENENEVQTQQPVQEQDNQPTQNEGQEGKPKVEFTPEQQKAISALLDSKIAKERTKAEQEKKNAINKAIARTKMSAEERAKAEQKDREDAFNRKQQDLDRQLREVKTKSMLIDKGITTDMLPLLMGVDDEETSQRLDLLDQYVNKKVQEATEKLMRGKQNPTNGNGGSNVSLSDNPWSAQSFNITKQQEIFNQDPEKARQMIAQAQPKQGFYVGKIN
ncbi:DUF4355 domain-containing protein [Limosilactobacillus reuteri]|uniref:DUF4355 domain-containing protein n=1 Tax=Limosilactobacillus reuteri TaxID=1598 RepID=A0A256VLG7_LIMRT|nr:DUF4355 domain-containing protein [Limosilactobacillus reuteri]OYS60507.1 hypothetical protein CBF88_02875 [Limosilactobacillus reuteri]OYS62131.1 hypothetical protein CBF91_02995 [Limosilactobacillus reuteri]OYS65346.1 hypothetical protein CBF89_02770 [Limosilactobacillus reuteri]OYS73533.1 hypothetical protein CBG01_02590 [Limosilactobacillus reuteri]OYS75662.1 hypothetical protein CBG08_04060 [Limosilactobacillus reuteri]